MKAGWQITELEEVSRRVRVLIISCEINVRKQLMLSLMRQGYDVIEAVDIREAMCLNRYLPADLLIGERGFEDYILGVRTFDFMERCFRIVPWARGVRIGTQAAEIADEIVRRLDSEPAGCAC